MLPSEQTLVRANDLVVAIVDVQEKLAAVMDAGDRVIARSLKLARAAALVGAPILLTRQYPKGLGPVVTPVERTLLELAHDGAHVIGIDKTAFCCASEPTFRSALESTGREQIVICGMETHICVTQTALALAGSRYQVQVAADACCSREREAHDLALERLRAAGVIVTHTESVMYEAVGVAATDQFKALLRIVKD